MADKRSPHWKERKLQHTQALTDLLAEHLDCSGGELPEIGYRPTEYIRVESLHNPSEHGYSTHTRQGDWEVVRVESYTPELPVGNEYESVVICYCRYNPINADLKPMPKRTVSLDSFGGDQVAYQEWLDAQESKQPVEA